MNEKKQLGFYIQYYRKKLNKTQSEFADGFCVRQTLAKIENGADSVDIVLALEAIQDTISMSTTIYDNGGDAIELEDQICDSKDIFEEFLRTNMIKEAFAKLSSREKTIIYDRYYLDKTQMEIAEELNISQAQVSRLEKNALKEMYDFMK